MLGSRRMSSHSCLAMCDRPMPLLSDRLFVHIGRFVPISVSAAPLANCSFVLAVWFRGRVLQSRRHQAEEYKLIRQVAMFLMWCWCWSCGVAGLYQLIVICGRFRCSFFLDVCGNPRMVMKNG